MPKKREDPKIATQPDPLQPQPGEKLGAYIRRVRMERRIKAVDVTKATRDLPYDQQWSSGYLSQVETGVAENPSHSHLLSLADALPIPIEWLASFQNDRAPRLSPPSTERLSSHLLDQITYHASQLDVDGQKLVLAIIEAIARQRGEK